MKIVTGNLVERRVAGALVAAAMCLIAASSANAQLPSALYTWDNTGNAAPNVENWVNVYQRSGCLRS